MLYIVLSLQPTKEWIVIQVLQPTKNGILY
jgi:hypothetical protein